jgi:hypothetical protein
MSPRKNFPPRINFVTAAAIAAAALAGAVFVHGASAQTIAPTVEAQPYGIAPYNYGPWWQYRGGPKSSVPTDVYNNVVPAPDVYDVEGPYRPIVVVPR